MTAEGKSMDPKIEILNIYPVKKAPILAVFTVKVTFYGKYEMILPEMTIFEVAEGYGVEIPSRELKGKKRTPPFYLNALLKEIIEDQALDAYEQLLAEKSLVRNRKSISLQAPWR
jgi:hypothetical protein